MELGVVFFSLVLARAGAFVAVMPLLGGNQIPRTVKVGLAVALAILWAGSFWDQVPACAWWSGRGAAPALCWGLALGREALLGALVGFAFGLFLVPARIAGEYLSQEMGLSFGSLMGIGNDGPSTPLAVIFELLAAAMFLGLDGHHLFLGVMHGTFQQYPVGGGLPQVSTAAVVQGVQASQEWGLMLAAPVAFCLFLITIVLALLTRAAPQLNLYSVGFPLRLAAGLVAGVLLLPQEISNMVNSFGQMTGYLSRLFF